VPRPKPERRFIEPPTLRLRVLFTERGEEVPVTAPDWVPQPTTVDLSRAIFDFNPAYELAVVRTVGEYVNLDLENFYLLGSRRPVRRRHQLIPERLSYESPLHFLGLIPHDVLWLGGGAAFVLKFRDALKAAYSIDLEVKNDRLKKQIENTRLRMQLDDLEQQATRRLKNRVQNQRLEPTTVEVESDDWPSGLE
jgi:hypothetical protein